MFKSDVFERLAQFHSELPLKEVKACQDNCPVCNRRDSLIYLQGDLSIFRLGRPGDLVIFELICRGFLLSYWRIDLPFYKVPNAGMVSQAELLEAIRKSPEQVAKIILLGGCDRHKKNWTAYFHDETKIGNRDRNHFISLSWVDPGTVTWNSPLDSANLGNSDLGLTL